MNRLHLSKKLSLLLTLILLITGCSSVVSGSGPSKRSILTESQKETPNYKFTSLSADNIAQYMGLKTAPLETKTPSTSIPDLRLTPGDSVRIMVSEIEHENALFSPLSTGGTTFDKVRINGRGHISLPYAGSIKISGYTLNQAETIIRDRLKEYTLDPQVFISLVSDISGSILVAGEVNKPGRFSTLDGPLTALDAISQAGGPKMEPYLAKVTIRTGKGVKQYSYQELLNGLNFQVPPNSEIIVEKSDKNFIAMGAVLNPGLHDFPSHNPNLLEVLGIAGGLDDKKADTQGVFIFRLNQNEFENTPHQPEVFHLDMRHPVSIFLARQFQIRPNDAIYITNAHVNEFQKIISPIIQVLILGNTIDN